MCVATPAARMSTRPVVATRWSSATTAAKRSGPPEVGSSILLPKKMLYVVLCSIYYLMLKGILLGSSDV